MIRTELCSPERLKAYRWGQIDTLKILRTEKNADYVDAKIAELQEDLHLLEKEQHECEAAKYEPIIEKIKEKMTSVNTSTI